MPLKYNNRIIAKNIVYCNSFLTKGLGLMFRSKSSVENTAWLFQFKKPRIIGITMLFVFFPIDVVLIGKNNSIIGTIKNLRPFRNYSTNTKIYGFIELKSGTIDKFKISKGKISIAL